MRAKAIAVVALSATALLVPAARAQAQGTAPREIRPTQEAEVWKAVELGHHVAAQMPEPYWETGSAPSPGTDAAVLRLQRQVLEAHAVGQGLTVPFARKVARQAFKGYLEKRFTPEQQEAVLAGLEKWGIAYSSAIELAAGDEDQLMGYIRHVFANAVEIDKGAPEVVEAAPVWRAIKDAVASYCSETVRHVIVVADEND